MKISTKGRYGLRLMVFLAKKYQKGNVTLKEISRDQDISEKYLEQIINPLTKAGLVTGFRGSQGGYTLRLDPNDISVGTILRILEGSLGPVDCVNTETFSCPRVDSCASISLWKQIKDAVENIVDNTSLADLVKDAEENHAVI